MKYKVNDCPICGTKSEMAEYDFQDKLEVICPRCGKYRISKWGLSSSDFHRFEYAGAILSYYIKNSFNTNDILDAQKINTILMEVSLPDYQTKRYNLLNWFAVKSKNTNRTVKGSRIELIAIIGCKDHEDFNKVLYEIWINKDIMLKTPPEIVFSQSESSTFEGYLTTKGLNFLEQK